MRRGTADSIGACDAGKWISLKDCDAGMVCKNNNCAFDFSGSRNGSGLSSPTSSAPVILGHTANTITVEQMLPTTFSGSLQSTSSPTSSDVAAGGNSKSKKFEKFGFSCTSFPGVLSDVGKNYDAGFQTKILDACNALASYVDNSTLETPREFYMFLANVVHESAWLQTVVEFKSVTDLAACAKDYHNKSNPEVTKWIEQAFPNSSYDPSKTIYFGRGYLQLTWAYNYGPASMDLLGNLDLLVHPERVANEPDLTWRTAFWYWKTKVQTAPGVSDGEFGASVKAINGALECSAESNPAANTRLQIYKALVQTYAPSEKINPVGCKGLEGAVPTAQ
ncbi:hypothetical protein FBU59_000866 [Linderina macrospora]|uniref:Uncharacterized protein n=1 Tax=Linderina macrospora TaxID=4868 RepID=A0ACC1JFV2_9FUNG|nr:hypothetical protein FBU59_000866 [Linderina macrospora]